MVRYRRSDYDVTNTVQVSSVAAVRRAVEELFQQAWPGAPFDLNCNYCASQSSYLEEIHFDIIRNRFFQFSSDLGFDLGSALV